MDHFRSDGKSIFLEDQSCEFYIPKYYFEESGGFAEDLGNTIRVFGVFDVGFFNNGKLTEMRVMNLPVWITIFSYDTEERMVNLPNDEEPTNCMVVKYNKGEKIMNDGLVEDSSNAEAYVSFVTKGKVPSIVPYEESLQMWRENQELNSVNLGVPSVILELILSVAYRYKKDPTQKFAHVIGKDLNVSQFDYTMNNIRQICQYTSTFTALTFEDLDAMVTTSLNRAKTRGANEAYSPLEDLLKL